MSSPSGFKSPAGKAAFLAVYDAAMKQWPVPFEALDVPTRFGATHVAVCGPRAAPPLVLLHGFMATSAMWALNIADFSSRYRVYAVDVMGQPSRSIPTQPMGSAADYAEWLTETLDALKLDRIALVGMSFGGWVALNYAIAAPARVDKLVLLSPGGLLPFVKQFVLRGMLMMLIPSRLTVRTFLQWVGLGGGETRALIDLTYLGAKHFRMPRVDARVFSDDELRGLPMPVLLLMGEDEVIYDSAQALARAQRLIPALEGELVPDSSHEMCVSQRAIVDPRVLSFLAAPAAVRRAPAGEPAAAPLPRAAPPGQSPEGPARSHP